MQATFGKANLGRIGGGEMELKVAILLANRIFHLTPEVGIGSMLPRGIHLAFMNSLPAGEKTSGRDYNGKVRRRRLVLPGFAVIPSLVRDRNRNGKL